MALVVPKQGEQIMLDFHLYVHVIQENDLGWKLDQVLASLNALQLKETADMTALSDKITAVGSELDAAVARVQQTVTDLQAKIAELQALIDQGLATPEDLAALDAMKAKLAALDPTDPTVLSAS